jgi:hypothetical protein
MTQEQIVDNIILDELELKHPGSKELILSKTTKSGRRMAMLSIMDDDRKLFEQYKNIIKSEEVCGNYAKEVIQILREYVKVADTEVKEHGEVMTPLTLVNEMLDKLPSEVWGNKDLKWLDPCNGVGTFPSVVVERLMVGLKDVIVDDCERYRHIIEKMIYVCEIQPKNMELFLCAFDREDDHELNIYYGSFLDKKFDEYMLNDWGVDKFDIVLGNPPYKNGTHHKFIVKGFNLLNEGGISLVVHPSTLLLSRKDVRKNNVEKEFLNIVSQYKTNLFLKDCSFYFTGVDLMVPLSITTIIKSLDNTIKITYDYFKNKEPKTEIVTTLESVYLHCDNRAFSIKQKVFNKMGTNSIENNLFRNGKVSSHYLSVNTLIGGELKNGKIGGGFFCLLNKCYENEIEQFISTIGISVSEKVHTNQISLNSHQECINTANTLMTKFMRFCVSLYKLSGYLTRGELKSVPFMDATIEWTDEMLYEYFELTNQEIKFINTFIEDWYERDINKYNEEYHTSILSENMINVWNETKKTILKLSDVNFDYKNKNYSSVWNDEDEVLCRINFTNSTIKINILRGNVNLKGNLSKSYFTFDDPNKLATESKQKYSKRDGTQSGELHWYCININEHTNLEYVKFLLNQKYNQLKNN